LKILNPSYLKLKKKIRIGIIGSGKIAIEYSRVVKSFNHDLVAVVSKSKKERLNKIFKNFKNYNKYNSLGDAINDKRVEAWIVACSYAELYNNFILLIKFKKNFIIEKSIICSHEKLKKISNSINNKDKKKFIIAYNRNHYDYVYSLIKEIKKDKIFFVNLRIADSYEKIIKKNNFNKKYHINYFITSHWIALIYKILKIIGYKPDFNKVDKVIYKFYQPSSLRVPFKKKNHTVYVNVINVPNGPFNHGIEFFCKKKYFNISPIEKLSIFDKIKNIKSKSNNFYYPKIKSLNVSYNFKPGFRLQYYEFIKKVLSKKISNTSIYIDDLIDIYKICEFFPR
jgi:hypothetical protein